MHKLREDSDNSRINEIILSTGNVNRPYIVRDIIFVAEKIEVDLFNPEIDPNDLLANVSYKLKEKANEYGADAVINCHFEHDRISENDTTYLEIFTYGTVVQFTQSTIGG